MARKKPVSLSSGHSFEGVGEAKLHFKSILNDTRSDEAVDPSNLAAVLALYKDYCVAAPGHEVAHKSKNVFRRQNNDPRPDGSHAVTECFYVQFENDEEIAFSYGKAVSAIANF